MSGGDGMEILNVGPGWSMTTKCVGYGRNGDGCGSVLKLSIDDVCNTLDYCSQPHNVTDAASVKIHRNRR